MKVLYLNCSSGISGDMVVGSLLGLGIGKKFLLDELKKLNLGVYCIDIRKVNKCGINAIKFNVTAEKQHKHRNLKDIFKIIDSSSLNRGVKSLSKKIFFNLAEAESKVHNISLDKVHFHEVGAVDSIVDIVASSILLNKLQIETILCSTIADGTGKVSFSHGTTSLPVPAVKELLKDAPMRALNINHELTTPTGAAIIKTIAKEFIDTPPIKIERKCFGAGSKDLPIPNVLQAIIGELKYPLEKKTILESNIDDMNPEFFQYIIQKLISASATEAFIKPVVMKKDRIGALLTVICDESNKDSLIEIIFKETTTFGIRVNKLHRIILEREIKKLKTPFGVIDIKVGKFKGNIVTAKPEYSDCVKAAEKSGIPIKIVYDKIKNSLYSK